MSKLVGGFNRSSKWQPVRKSKPATVATVKKLILKNEEAKHHDATTTDVVTTTSDFFHATNIAEGDDYNERVGRDVKLLSLQFKGQINCITTSDVVRVYCVYDREPQQAQPAVTDILVADGPFSFPNLNNRKRFKLLYDKVFNLTLADGAEMTYKTFKFYKRFKTPKLISWKTDGANIPNKGAIYMYAVALNNAAATVNWTINSRLRFCE